MKPLIIIRAIGSWNSNIFTPDWVSKYLLLNQDKKKKDGEQISLLFNPDIKEFGFVFNEQKIQLFTKSNEISIVLKSKDFSEKNMGFAANLLNRLFNLLPHTPIQVVGINFDYFIKKEETNSLSEWSKEVFKNSFDDFTTKSISIRKGLKNCVLNIVAENQGKMTKANFNFHYKSLIDFNEAVFKEHLELTKKILNGSK